MHILMVHIHVKTEHLDAFLAATRDNASNSLKEPGVVRFDVLQEKDDPTHITLVEVYHNASGHEQHRTTDHYHRWLSSVEGMMDGQRTRTIYTNVFPEDADWR